MNVLDFIVWCINSVTDGSFVLMSLSDMSSFVTGTTYFTQILDPSFLMSLTIWLSVFFFVWKFTYNIFFRLCMHLVNFPKKKNQKG